MARIGSYPIDAVIQDKDAWIGTENTNRVTRQFTAKGIAEYIDTKNVGLVFVGATALADGKKGLVPAPVAGQEGMYLKGDLGGGWTTIPVYTLDVPTGTTNVNLINTDGAGAIINSFITLTGGTYLTSVHTSGSEITFNHDNTTRSDTTSTASPAAGASVPLVASVTSNATGHITAIDVKTVTWPADSDTTYTIDVPNATTSINLAGSDGTNDPIAFTTVAGNNGMTISRTDANTLNFNSKWQINNVNQDGYVPKGQANANKFWATDGNGNPGWTFQPSQDQTLTSTGTTNASTGIVLSQNGGTVIVKGDGTTINASSNNNTNTITLAAINRVNTTYTLPVAAGAANTAVINLTDNSSVVSSVTFNGTANKIAISETVGNNGDITIGMPDDVTVTGELTVSGTGQSSFGGQVTIPQTPTADTDAASKKYVDDLVSGGLTFRGTFRADTGEILSGVSSGSKLYNCPGGAGTRIAVAVGDYYIVATAGGSFYCSGATLDIGDSIIATAAANADASVVTGWSVVQSDEGVASFTNANGTFVSAGTVNSNATGAVTMGTIDLSATGTKNNTTFLRGDNTWAVPAYVSYSAMTTSTLGLGKIKYDFGSTPAAESQSTTAARTYGVTKNASDQLVVNVPWVNSSDVNSVTASGATTALSGLTSTPNTGSVVIGLDINGRASLGTPAANDELMIYDTSTAKNVKVLVSDLASYAGSAATNQVTYWTSANEIGGAAGFTFAGGANGAITMGGALTVAGDSIFGGTVIEDPNSLARKIEIAAASPVGLILNDTRDTHPITLANEGAVLNLKYNTTSMLSIDGASTNATFAGDVIQSGTSKSLKYWRRLWADANNDWGLNNNAGTGVISVSGMGTPSTSTTTFTGSVIANNTSKIEKAQITTQFDTSSFLRLHPSATTNSGGYTNMIFGTDTANNYGVAIGGRRAGTDGEPSFSMRMLNDSITGTEVLNISNSGTATFAGKINITQNSGDFILENTGSGHASLTTGSSKDLNISSSSGNVYINNNTTFAGKVGIGGKAPTYGITLAQGTGVNNKIAWTDVTPNFRASIFADSSDDKFKIATGNASSVETIAIEIDTSQKANFTGNLQAPRIGIGAVNASFNLYNNGTTYLNGDVTIDANTLFSGNNVDIKGSNAGNTQIRIADSTGTLGSNSFDLINDGAAAYVWNRKQTDLNFATYGSLRMKIRASGTVGIGANGGYDSQMLSIDAGVLDGAIYATSSDANCFASFRDGNSSANIEYGAVGNDHVLRKDAAHYFVVNNVGDVYNYQSVNRASTYYGYDAGNYNATGASNNAFGYEALSDITSGTENVAIGRNAGHSINTGVKNICIGQQAGENITDGASNTVIGVNAGDSLVSADNNVILGRLAYQAGDNASNVVIGIQAGYANNGAENVFIGGYAGRSATISNTVAIGYSALYNCTANANVAIGQQAAESTTSGAGNTVLGYHALKDNTTGNANVAIGQQALTSSTDAAYSVAIGHEAGYGVTTGDFNVVIGDRAGRVLAAGAENTLIGAQTGYDLTGGNYNTCIGFKNLFAATSGEFNTSMGFAALNQSTTSENAAFGAYAMHYSTSAQNGAAFGFKALFSQTTAEGNTAFGFQCMEAVSTGAKNTAVGRSAGDSINTGSEHTMLGYQAGDELTTGSNCIAIGYAAGSGSSPRQMTTNSNEIVIGNNSIVGAYVRVAWTTGSDKRDKINFGDVPHGLDFVNKLKPTSYDLRKERDSDETIGERKYGFIAQEILELEGDNPVIIDNSDENKLALQDSNLIPILVNAIQELKAEIEILKNK